MPYVDQTPMDHAEKPERWIEQLQQITTQTVNASTSGERSIQCDVEGFRQRSGFGQLLSAKPKGQQ